MSANPVPPEGESKAVDHDSGLLKSSSVVGICTFLSRILGLARDVVFARVIGAEALADVFFVAFKIPNFFRRLFAEGAFSQAFVPVLGEYREKGSAAAVRELSNRIAGTLGFTLLSITVVIVVASPVMAALFAPRWLFDDPQKFAATAQMLRITFPYLLFISMTGVAGAILNSYDRFAVPAFTPVLLNVVLIFAALQGARWLEEPAFALAWGVFAAGVVQLLFQLPFLARIHMLPSPSIDWQHPGVRKVLRLMGPAIFGVSVGQINLLLDTILATFLPTGSVSWLYYSDRLSELPLGVFGVAIATVILPNLSRHHAAASPREFSQTLDWALRMILLVSVPAATALILLAEPILLTLFYHGDVITPRDITMATYSLRAFALGLVAFMLIKILAPGFYARQDMKTPVRIGIVAMIANMIFNVLLVIPLHFYWKLGHVGLALATSGSALLNAYLLFRGLRRDAIFEPLEHWMRTFVHLAIAVFAMVVALYMVLYGLDAVHSQVWREISAMKRITYLIIACSGGLIAYWTVLFALGFRLADLRGPRRATARG